MMNTSMNSYIKLTFSLLLLLVFLVDTVVPFSAYCDPSKQTLEDICLKKTPFFKVCYKTLQSDPRSATATHTSTLVQVMLDAVESNANVGAYRTRKYFNDAKDPVVKSSLRTCSSKYVELINRVGQAKEAVPYQGGRIAIYYVQGVLNNWDECEIQFAVGQSPLSSINKHGKKLTEVLLALSQCSGSDLPPSDGMKR